MKNILVADNDMDVVSSIKDMLSPYYLVDIAITGFEVVQLCERNAYAGMIIDVDFGPGISGLEIVSIIRSKNKHVRILICSAFEYSNNVRQQTVDLGAAFCIKPLDLDFVRRVFEESKNE